MNWLDRGWQVFGPEPAVDAWVSSVKGPALEAVASEPKRHGGTWSVGVDALPNRADGALGEGPALGGAAFAQAVAATGVAGLHRAQISVMHPGYPRQDADESDANHRFRKARDAAHLDGLLPVGPDKRRHLQEPHAWILGVALTTADEHAAPLVVWDRSHHVIRAAFERAFAGIAPDDWAKVDVTDIYKAARAEVFETCARVPMPLSTGGSVLLHRMAIHGVAPWATGVSADPQGRAIAYFRPCFHNPAQWLSTP